MDKKKLFGILALILLTGGLLRFLNISKPEGMWNDEYLTWEIAHAAFPKEFFEGIIRNCHAPLHYLYLKIWMYFFKESDFSLRMSSYVPGVLSIIVMFFAGKHISEKKGNDTAGLVAAGMCAISSFLIYFSQEVRIYSLLFLLSAIHVYFALKTLDNPSKKNCTFFTVSLFLIMLEHTIGFVFAFFSSAGVILFASKNEKFKKYFLTTLLIALLIFIPVGIFLYKVMFNQEYFSQWWAPFSWAKLAFFFTDLFSPYLVNITNAPPSFWSMVYDGKNINFGFTLFAFIPFTISILCIIRGIFNFNSKVKYFLLTSIGVYITVFLASLFDKILFLTKYLTEIYPALILLMAYGLASFKSKGLKTILVTVYTVVCIFFITASQYSPVKLIRKEGQNIPVVMLQALDYKQNDKILFLYYPKERFSKYSKEISENKNTSHISKYDFLLIKGEIAKLKEAYKNGRENYKEIFLSKKNPELDNFLNKNIFSSIKKGDKFFLVDFSPVSLFQANELEQNIIDDNKYKKTPFLYLVFSYARNYIIAQAGELLSYNNTYAYESWKIYVFEKT